MNLSTLSANAAVKINEATHRTLALPLLIFFPTARCNSRCISCNWWQTDGATDLTLGEVRTLVDGLAELRTRLVLFSGGEPLQRREVFDMADLFRGKGIKLHLLTSGLLLEKFAQPVASRFEQVTISLDGPTRELYREIRGIDALRQIERGVACLQDADPSLPVRARSTLHRHNFIELPHLVDKAKEMKLAQISFLAADVTSEAFGRRNTTETKGLLLNESQVLEFSRVIEECITSHAADFDSHFIAESPEKLRRLPQYYRAQLGLADFPTIACNAPWTSAVVEANGAVRPCYFQPAIGNIREKKLGEILSGEMVSFRQGLTVRENPTCRKCVCTLKVGMRSKIW
jgi:MoaA/NifB/PqqE/SkfB family radical SAM enzyme